jgi:hypothetical protein
MNFACYTQLCQLKLMTDDEKIEIGGGIITRMDTRRVLIPYLPPALLDSVLLDYIDVNEKYRCAHGSVYLMHKHIDGRRQLYVSGDCPNSWNCHECTYDLLRNMIYTYEAYEWYNNKRKRADTDVLIVLQTDTDAVDVPRTDEDQKSARAARNRKRAARKIVNVPRTGKDQKGPT